MKSYKIRFNSVVPDYSELYKFNMEFVSDSKPSVNVKSTLNMTDYFDDKGYLHRYKVKQFINDSIDEKKFDQFADKKKK